MGTISEKLGVQSYCFRGFKENAKVAELVKQCGINKLELCGVHADFLDESSFAGVIDTYVSAGIEIVAIGVQGFSNNEASERKYCEFAKQAGVKYMSISVPIETAEASFKAAEKLAEEYDLYLAIHNHGGWDWLGNSITLRNVFKNTGPRIGLCLDTAWCLDSGEDPLKWVNEFGSRLYGLHIKDFVFDRARKPEDVVVGTGNLNLPLLISTLEAANYSGYTVLEYEGDVDNPVPALTECVQAVQAA